MPLILSQMVRDSIAHDVPLDNTNQGGSNGFTETICPGHISTINMAQSPQAVSHTQPVSELSLVSTRYHGANLGTVVSIFQLVSVDISAYLYISLFTPHSMRPMSRRGRPFQALPKASQTLSVTGCSLQS